MQAFLTGTSGITKTKDKPVSKESGKGKTKHVPWVEKYRPKCVDDVAYQDEVVAVLKKSLQNADLPNLLFYGPPGTGKTSTILAASRELFGDMYKTRVLELNASDERGIDVIREKVKTFAQLTASGTRPDGKPCPPFKIVILDEADSMTNPAQVGLLSDLIRQLIPECSPGISQRIQTKAGGSYLWNFYNIFFSKRAALRRTMEKQSKTTRFCLICNYVSRIIEPITSRCAKFRFKPLAEDILAKRLRHICDKEEIKCEDEAIHGLMYTSEGDLRKAITYLQSAARLKGGEEITKTDIYEIAGVIHDDVIDRLIEVCNTDSYENLEQELKSVMMEGHSGMQVITQLHDKLVEMDTLTDKQKSVILEKLAVVDKCLIDGADEYLQLMSLFTTMMQQICHGEK